MTKVEMTAEDGLDVGTRVIFPKGSGNEDDKIYTVDSSDVLQGNRFYRLKELPGSLFRRRSLVRLSAASALREAVPVQTEEPMYEICAGCGHKRGHHAIAVDRDNIRSRSCFQGCNCKLFTVSGVFWNAASALGEKEEPADGWISVKDRLPERPENGIEASDDVIGAVIGLEGIERWDRICRCAFGDEWARDGIVIRWSPTHWQPLPAPPLQSTHD